MVLPNRTASRTSHSLKISALAAAITMAIGGAHAQVRVEAQSEAIRGRAPVVTIAPVENQSVAGQAPAVGHVLHVDATVVDPDGDPITGTTYRWRRGATEVGTGQDYTTTAADAGAALTVEATATTDSATTDPDVGTASENVSVVANTAPFVTAGSVQITGTYAVGETLTAVYGTTTPKTTWKTRQASSRPGTSARHRPMHLRSFRARRAGPTSSSPRTRARTAASGSASTR